MELRPLKGLNMRHKAYDVGRDHWMLMQNFDQDESDNFMQIDGSTKYHGTSLGTNAPTCIMPYYNQSSGDNHVLVAVDDKIMKRSAGTNEFTTVYQGLRPNVIRSFYMFPEFGKMFIAHPDGLLEYDGIDVSLVNKGPKLSYIIYSLETNRCFGIMAETPLVLAYTDDLTQSGGIPINWNVTNLQAFPSFNGDEMKILDFMDGRLIIGLGNQIWIGYVNGGPTQWRFEKAETDVGIIASSTWVKVGPERYYLGFSDKVGKGLFSFNGRFSKFIGYNIQPFIDRINPNRIERACGIYYNKKIRYSFAIDSAIENNYTVHIDVLKVDTDTEVPNIYGPHNYGFNCAAALNTSKFGGELLMGVKYKDAAWIMKEDKVMTRNGTPMQNDGDLIPAVLLSGAISSEETPDGIMNETWVKRYGRMRTEYPPSGNWNVSVEVMTDFSNLSESWEQELDTINLTIESFIFGTFFEQFNLGIGERLLDARGRAIQIRISNYKVNTKAAFRKFLYDVRACHVHKEARRIYV